MKTRKIQRNSLPIFWKQVRETGGEFGFFLKSHRREAVVSAIAAVLFYGILVLHGDITIDSEIMKTIPQEMLRSWVGINRFGLVVTKVLFGMTCFVPEVSNGLMIVGMWLFGLLFNFCIHEWGQDDRRYRFFYWVFPVLWMSVPLWAEQMYFTLQVFEISWAFLLSAAAVYCAGKVIYSKESRWWLLPGIGCMVWAIGSYQVFAAVLAALVLISFLVVYQSADGQERIRRSLGKNGWLKAGAAFAGVFLLSFLLYFLAAGVIKNVLGIQGSAYVSDMIHWKTQSFFSCLQGIYVEVKRILLAGTICYSRLFTPVLLLFAALTLYRGLGKKGNRGKVWFLLALLLLLLSPFYMTVIAGCPQQLRSQLVYPLLFAFMTAYLTTIRPGRMKWLPAAIAFCSFCLAWNQGYLLTRLFQEVHRVAWQDQRRAEEIYFEAQKLAASEGADIRECCFTFVGTRAPELNGLIKTGDVIGYSFFEWDAEGPVGVSARAAGMMGAYGMESGAVTQQQYEEGKKMAEDMTVWPAEGSMKKEGNLIVVKLSEPEENQ